MLAARDPLQFEPELRHRRDTITTALMIAAAPVAIGGFAVLFSLWWRTCASDDYDVLRIASQEFVSGRPIVAGELAQTVVFEEPAVALDTALDETAPTDARPAVQVSIEDKTERRQWECLRDFLVGAARWLKRLKQRSCVNAVGTCTKRFRRSNRLNSADFHPGGKAKELEFWGSPCSNSVDTIRRWSRCSRRWIATPCFSERCDRSWPRPN